MDENNFRVILKPDVSRGDKLNTAMSWDDTAFLVNLRIGRAELSKKGEERYEVITVPMQVLSWICVTSTSFVVVFLAIVKKLNRPHSRTQSCLLKKQSKPIVRGVYELPMPRY